MRPSSPLILALFLLAGGCTLLRPEQQAAPQPRADVDWMLVTPPDNPAVTHLVDGMNHLPGQGHKFPEPKNGLLSETQRGTSLLLFDEAKRQSSQRDKAAVLERVAVMADTPVREWNQVRRFKSREECETRRSALRDVTRAQRDKIEYYPDIMMDELTFLFLARSYEHSRCVPADTLPKVTQR